MLIFFFKFTFFNINTSITICLILLIFNFYIFSKNGFRKPKYILLTRLKFRLLIMYLKNRSMIILHMFPDLRFMSYVFFRLSSTNISLFTWPFVKCTVGHSNDDFHYKLFYNKSNIFDFIIKNNTNIHNYLYFQNF